MSASSAPASPTPPYRRKLIEVALPLDDINRESAREKSIRHGHPSTLHLWWARRPLAACRAVLFAQMVDDPSGLPDEFPTEEAQAVERERLFDIIRDLVRWENSTNGAVLHRARVEIARSAARNSSVALWPGELAPSITVDAVAEALRQYAPPVLDPFAGGGSIPLEAQRLGLEAHASDLNPVAVLINKALIEIPPKFAGRPPVNPESRKKYLHKEWHGAEGLAEDVRYYGKWMRDEAFKRIGHLYPKVQLPKGQGGGDATVIAWLWARTVKCPNPACGAHMPLVRSFALSTKKGKEAFAEPQVNHTTMPPTISFKVGHGKDVPEAPKVGRGAQFRCLACDSIAPEQHIKDEAIAGRMGAQMMAIVAEGKSGRVYIPPSDEQVIAAKTKLHHWRPDARMPDNPRWFSPPMYGLDSYGDLFTPRQLVTLTTCSDLVDGARASVLRNTEGDTRYADAVATYLAEAVSKLTTFHNTLTYWRAKENKSATGFGRQALAMTWDYVEVNPFAGAGGDFSGIIEAAVRVTGLLPAATPSRVVQNTATEGRAQDIQPVVSTDPPYYDNIGYADLSDFFYVWLRRTLDHVYPELFSTLLTPKSQELIATPYRFGGSVDQAKKFFEEGLGRVFARLQSVGHSAYPMAVYYAFKQSEADDLEEGERKGQSSVSASTGWETMLEGLLRAEFCITGTWPLRTEGVGRLIAQGTNALASSIVLVCNPRPADAPMIDRRGFLNTLKRELPQALRDLQRGNIAPVDLAQAAIGPGMAVFSRYRKVLEADGSAMRVRTALQIINQTLDEVLAEQEGEFDADTRFAVAWFEQFGMGQGKFGDADVMARAKNTSVSGLAEAGILEAHGGNVRLLRCDELPEHWNPHQDHRPSIWKVTQHLIQAVVAHGSTSGVASALLDAVGPEYGDKARDLAYRLYTTSERRKWAQDAFAYNALVTEWHDIAGGIEGVRQQARATVTQGRLMEP